VAAAQDNDGGTTERLLGSALGAYSGATLGLLGGMLPCNRTLSGRGCSIAVTAVGGTVGLAMGGIIGARDTDQLHDRLGGAGLGAVIGAAVGVGLRRAVRQYDWADVGAVAFVGGAIGASPEGVLIGLPVGLAAGAILWAARPKSGLQDFIMLSLVGAAVGGLYDWVDGAAQTRDTGPAIPGPTFSIPVR